MADKNGDKSNLILKILLAIFVLLSLALLIALIVVATRNNEDSTAEIGDSAPNIGDCPETTQLSAPSKASHGWRELYQDLSKEEIIAVRDYIIKQPSLNVTAYENANINDNYIYLIELQQPVKSEALAYLDTNNAPKPARKARVVLYNGGKANPDVTEYLVSPVEKPSQHKETKGPGQKYPIPFNTRFPDPKEFDFMGKLIRNLTSHPGVDKLLKESTDGYSMLDCVKPKCLTWGSAAPSTFKINERKTWTWLMRDLIGYYIHPVGFEMRLDTSGNDLSLWKVDKIFYNNATYDTVDELVNAFNSGSKMPVFEAPEENGRFSTYERRGNKEPAKPLRNPQLYEPDGKRYTVSGRHIEYMGWSFCFRSRTSSGIQLFDIRFKGDRIVYELSAQEAEAFYSGWAPKPMFTNFLDTAWNMGSMSFELLRGVDCPNTATFFDLTHFIGVKEPAVYKNAVCIFEQDMGIPLRRHYDTDFQGSYNFYGGVPGSALILRTASTTYNYDYVLDYIFYPNGVLEVRTTTSGYAQTTFYTPDEDPYAYQIHPKMAGSLHDHIFNYKVDIDVRGTKNSHQTVEVGLENITNPWFPGDRHVQKILKRRVRTNERDAVYHFNFQTPTLLNFFNREEKNAFGVHRGYRIQIRDMMKQMIPEAFPMIKGAAWSLNQMTVTKQKDSEEKSSCMYNQLDMADPVLDFTKFYADNEGIENEDLVAWVTIGMMHVMHSEDVPNTATPGNSASFYLRPFSYFDEDPSMGMYDGVVIKPKAGGGSDIDTLGSPKTQSTCAPKNKPIEFFGRYGNY